MRGRGIRTASPETVSTRTAATTASTATEPSATGSPADLGEQADRGRAAEQARVADRGGQRDAPRTAEQAGPARSPAGRRWPAPGRPRTKPASATPREDVVTAARAPAAASSAPPTSSRRSPSACSSRPPTSRPHAMAREKPAYPAAATWPAPPRCSRSSSAPQSVSAPSPKAVQPAMAPSTTSTAVGRGCPRRRAAVRLRGRGAVGRRRAGPAAPRR